MDEKRREIEELRQKSRQNIDSNKLNKIGNYKSTQYNSSFGRLGDADTASVFFMLRVCLCFIIVAVFIAGNIFMGNETAAVFNSSSEYISKNITIDEIVGQLRSFSLDSLMSLFR